MGIKGLMNTEFTTFRRDIILLKGWKYDIMKEIILLFYFGVLMGIISILVLIFLIKSIL